MGMDFQEVVNNALAARRAKEMKTSPQLTLGELILKLEAVKNRNKKIRFDFGTGLGPTDIMSWRGSYCELCVDYGNSEIYSASKFLLELKGALGETFTGYKGGEFLMGKTTPVWVAHYSDSGVDNYKGYKGESNVTVAIVDIVEGKDIIIKTDAIEY